ncbi:MAG: protein adenylyltransferase SelO [Tahibacter sp.]
MHTLRWDNAFVRDLPGDPETGPRQRQVEGALHSRVDPTAVAAPKLIAWSEEVAAMLDIAPATMTSAAFAEVMGGNRVLPGMQPFAANYGGHQFGHWAGQLGDGRAISLGETISGEGKRWELQLKGAGPTPYSRNADGRAVLRSSIREFLCSEAMHHLRVPTTRALSLVLTGDAVMRDMFYDGHPQMEAGAIVCRVAPSFLRFGNFELPSARGDLALLSRLIDFTIARDFPSLSGTPQDLRTQWFAQVCERTARMVAEWMRVGFVHGVMNTDNMSILGLTIDYGPYGWIDNFDLDWTPNTTDRERRRYRFGQQPQIAYWNLGAFAQALAPVFGSAEPLQEGLQRYVEVFQRTDGENMAAKLGLLEIREDDTLLIQQMYTWLTDAEVDMTIFFRALADLDIESPQSGVFADAYYDPAKRDATAGEFASWLQRYAVRARCDAEPIAQRRERMRLHNPRYVLRNYLAQQAIDRATAGDYEGIWELLRALRNPYDEQPHFAHLAAKRPDWARSRAGCSMLSCSS